MSERLFCENCNQDRDYKIIEDTFPYYVKGEIFEIQGRKALCGYCGDEVFDLEIEQENQTKAFNAYRQKYKLLTSEQVKSIREKYNLSQEEFSLLLGFSQNTIARIERGSIQTVEQNRKIVICYSPERLKELIEKNQELSEAQKEELKKRIKNEEQTDDTGSNIESLEKETLIKIDETINIATVFTTNWTVARSLKKAGYPPIKKSKEGWWFKIPINSISIQGDIESVIGVS